jgi:hypothetical protein
VLQYRLALFAPSSKGWPSPTYLRHVDLSLVHKFDDGHNVGERRVLENDHLMRLVEIYEELLKV